MSCLLPEGWLNDEIINFNMEMLEERDGKYLKNNLKINY